MQDSFINEQIKENVVNRENALKDFRLAKMFSLICNGEYDAPITKLYLENMAKYAKYCKEDMQDIWKEKIAAALDLTLFIDNHYILYELYIKERVGMIMEDLASGVSLEDIAIKLNEETNSTLEFIGEDMVYFSPYGAEFWDYLVAQNRLKR